MLYPSGKWGVNWGKTFSNGAGKIKQNISLNHLFFLGKGKTIPHIFHESESGDRSIRGFLADRIGLIDIAKMGESGEEYEEMH